VTQLGERASDRAARNPRSAAEVKNPRTATSLLQLQQVKGGVGGARAKTPILNIAVHNVPA